MYCVKSGEKDIKITKQKMIKVRFVCVCVCVCVCVAILRLNNKEIFKLKTYSKCLIDVAFSQNV